MCNIVYACVCVHVCACVCVHVCACVCVHVCACVCSLGTRPSKNRKGGSGTSAGVEVYTVPGMKAHFRLAFD